MLSSVKFGGRPSGELSIQPEQPKCRRRFERDIAGQRDRDRPVWLSMAAKWDKHHRRNEQLSHPF